MTDLQMSVRNASRLVYKSLNAALTPVNDLSYRELLAHYRADPAFADQVHAISEGMELVVLDVSERGLVVAPTTKDSKFALKMSDIRSVLNADQKAAMVLAHIAIAATFFPTMDGLEDDGVSPPPAALANFRDVLVTLARRLKEVGESEVDLPFTLEPGWELICSLPLTTPSVKRAGVNTIVGLIAISLAQMVTGGLVRVVRASDDESLVTYTPTNRFRVQLRELTMRRLFELAQADVGSTPPEA